MLISNKTPWLNLQDSKVGWDVDIENDNSLVQPIQQALSWNQDEFNSFEESMISRRLQLLIRAESALNYRFLPRRTASLIDDNYGQILTNELEFIFSKTHEKSMKVCARPHL